jgi:hypothetical protein
MLVRCPLGVRHGGDAIRRARSRGLGPRAAAAGSHDGSWLEHLGGTHQSQRPTRPPAKWHGRRRLALRDRAQRPTANSNPARQKRLVEGTGVRRVARDLIARRVEESPRVRRTISARGQRGRCRRLGNRWPAQRAPARPPSRANSRRIRSPFCWRRPRCTARLHRRTTRPGRTAPATCNRSRSPRPRHWIRLVPTRQQWIRSRRSCRRSPIDRYRSDRQR